jgi:hypothetical protein
MEPALQRRIQRYGWDKASVYYENFLATPIEAGTGPAYGNGSIEEE